MSHTTSTDIEMIVDTSLRALTETDPVRRAELIGQAWSEDGSLTDPPLVGEGHAGLNDFAGTLCQHFAGQQFRRVSGIDGHHDRFRYAWELVTADGRLRTVTGFFGDRPAR
jgi:hypothetical protein